MQKYRPYLGKIPNGLYCTKTQYISAPKKSLGRSHKITHRSALEYNHEDTVEDCTAVRCQRFQISNSYLHIFNI